ncbi:MAG: GNAT family N-acetyltransferase, partial [Achromobacter pestifer]
MPLPLLQPVTLEGDIVRLEPLAAGHADALSQIGLHPELWRLQPEPVASAEDMQRYVDRALAGQREGACLPFVIVQQSSGQIIGATRYMDIALSHHRLEIGATWLT